MYRWPSSIIISLLIINLYVLPVLDTRADTIKSVNVPSYGVIIYSVDLNQINLIINANFTNNMNNWGVYPEEAGWWSIDISVYYSSPASLKCVLPERQNDNIWDPPHSGGWSHTWNVRIPVQAGQRVKAYGLAKTENAYARCGIDFRNAENEITRGFNCFKTPYNTDLTKMKLEDESDIQTIDWRTHKDQITLTVQEGEVSVLFKFQVTKEYGDRTSGTAWFDNAELYLISPP